MTPATAGNLGSHLASALSLNPGRAGEPPSRRTDCFSKAHRGRTPQMVSLTDQRAMRRPNLARSTSRSCLTLLAINLRHR
jgi:hypothetical protein